MINEYFYEKQGFTLIELLVVISIIGLLSSIVFASLQSVRDKADRAVVASSMNTIRTQAELYYYNNNNKYGAPYTLPRDISLFAPQVSDLGGTVFSSYLVLSTGNTQLPPPCFAEGSGGSIYQDPTVLKAI